MTLRVRVRVRVGEDEGGVRMRVGWGWGWGEDEGGVRMGVSINRWHYVVANLFCSFSLPCSLLSVLPCYSSLCILSLLFIPTYISTFSLIFFRFGHQIQVPVSSSFSSLQYTSFSSSVWRTSPFSSIQDVLFSPCLSLSLPLCFPLFLLSAHSRAPMKYKYRRYKYPVSFFCNSSS